MDDPTLKKGSVAITQGSVSIAFSKEVEPFEPAGYLGVGVNERNMTISATDGRLGPPGEAMVGNEAVTALVLRADEGKSGSLLPGREPDRT